jgi:hypothetical protein
MGNSSVGPLQPWLALALKSPRFWAAIAVAGLATALAGSGGAAEVGAQAQPHKAPNPPVAAQPNLSAEELERWRRTIVHTKRPKKACFTAQYPATAWTEVPCGKPPKIPLLPANRPQHLIGNYAEDAVAGVSRTIQSAEGSFDSVTGVTSECNAQCPTGGCTKDLTCKSSDPSNDYSLQLNTNKFLFYGGCEKGNGCVGWQQFVFINNECPLSQESPLPACAYIQYWLIGYGQNCPNNWESHKGDCYINSQNSVNFLPFPLSDLGKMKLTGAVPGVLGLDDTVTLTVGAQAWSAPGDNLLNDLVDYWNNAEFNVFGTINGSQAVFNSGSTMVVRIVVGNETPNAPTCSGQSTTLETNNLMLGVLQTRPTHAPIDIVSTQSGNVFTPPGGPGPALVFVESNAPDVVSAGCAGTAKVAGEGAAEPPRPVPPIGGDCTGKKCCEATHGKCTVCVGSDQSCP